MPPLNNTCDPVTTPPADTLNLLDEINDTGSVVSTEDDNWNKVPLDMAVGLIVKPDISCVVAPMYIIFS